MPDERAAGRTGGDHESMPYESLPFARTQPSSLAALAQVLGFEAAPVQNARVLELGCASGGNIIPIAARFPAGRFVGIDISERHVAIARERIAVLGLGNIEVRRGDVADLDLIEGEFDYILCHGLYSWVPPAVQQAILALCGQRLSPRGLAYISYNVLPGWHLRSPVRDAMRFHAGDSGSPQERVARAREMLGQMVAASPEGTPYGQLIRHEAKQLATYPDSYILAEFLAEENHPCTVRDFARRAGEAGLAYLADTDLKSAFPDVIGPELGRLVASSARRDRLTAEHYFDIFQGRQFRQSILVRRGSAFEALPSIDPERIASLHFSSRLQLKGGPAAGSALTLRDPDGKGVTTNDPLAARAIDDVAAAFPETRSLPQIMGHLGLSSSADAAATRDRILDMLARLVVAGLVEISTTPVLVGKASDSWPAVWAVARQEQATGQPWVTNLRHMPVRLDPATATVLPLLEGSNDRQALAARLEPGLIDNALHRLEAMALLARPAGFEPAA